ncbi:hypothetical protein LTR36_009540 [Oleoguttula mirabilis]|uniref:Uncharacterized protein n=1 Tax=Oleoguttula mirabilis TaxID=1507867 RepID=A0AAV9JT16_9PEZI|nr:hypothetical protein LTR36_009540 [Oleoguttula mirabilis]
MEMGLLKHVYDKERGGVRASLANFLLCKTVRVGLATVDQIEGIVLEAQGPQETSKLDSTFSPLLTTGWQTPASMRTIGTVFSGAQDGRQILVPVISLETSKYRAGLALALSLVGVLIVQVVVTVKTYRIEPASSIANNLLSIITIVAAFLWWHAS